MREVVDNDNIDEIEIDLKGLMSYIMSRLTIIILIGILAAGVTFVYTKFFVRPQYVSKTKVYILCKQDPKEDYLTASDLAFASQLANDYPQLLISEPILDKVISDLNLGTSIANLDSNIKVELIENTRILQISVTNPEPVQAKKIADKLREVANSRLKEMMDGLEPVKSVNEATLPDKPDSPNISRNTILGFLIGAMLTTIICVILFILDDTIKTPEDIEKRLGVSVLGVIPLKKDKNSRKYGYGGYGYGGYGYGYGYGGYGHRSKKKVEPTPDELQVNDDKEA